MYMKRANLTLHARYHHDHSHPHDESLEEIGPRFGGGHTHTHQNTKAVLNRLAKVTGHLTSVRTMVEDGKDCAEVLIQLAAVRSAINGICKIILKDHIDHCIVDAVEKGDMETLQELNKSIEMLMK